MANITLDTKVLDGIIKHLGGNVAEAIEKVAFAVEARAKVNAPVDTGALRASIYTSVRRGGNSPQHFTGVDYIDLPTPPNAQVVYVGPSVEYGAAVHFGTHGVPGRPYLLDAVRQTENMFRDSVAKAVTNGR
jgi:HK97 gp10 family phage protein